jgi:hypothetical protein
VKHLLKCGILRLKNEQIVGISPRAGTEEMTIVPNRAAAVDARFAFAFMVVRH